MTTGKVKIKICGMRDSKNIMEVSALHPDYLGFIFYDKSPRYVGEEFIMPTELSPNINRVGVFVNHNLEDVIAKVEKYKLKFVQLHGDESIDYCSKLKERGVGIIKVFRIDDSFDFSRTINFESVVDYFLFDTKGKYYGGNAIPFGWSILENYNHKIPFFLSGGLQASNISEINKFNSWNIHAIDLNSGVEDSPAIKNINKIKEILNKLSI
jgi:phosphoribosylanthranilate isomerase